MRWLVRFLGWATLLSIPCFLIMERYQAAMAGIIMGILGLVGVPVRLELRLQEPFNLGIYASMCLASSRAPWSQRVRAVAIGIPVLALFGLTTVAFVIGGSRLISNPDGTGSYPAATRLLLSAIEAIPWLSAPALWLVLLGNRVLPRKLLHSAV